MAGRNGSPERLGGDQSHVELLGDSLMSGLLGRLLSGPLVLAGAHLVVVCLLKVVAHFLRAAADVAILGAA